MWIFGALAAVFALVCAAPNTAASATSGAGQAAAPAATIVDSGSTNTAGYTIVLHPDGGAQLTIHGRTTSATIPLELTHRFFGELAQTGALGRLPSAACIKSVSFGTSTRVTYDGQTSPDLSCGFDPNVRHLSALAAQIAGAAGAYPRPKPPQRF